MRILNDSENIAKRIEDGGDPNPLAHFLHGGALFRPERNQSMECRLCIRDAPVGDGAAISAGSAGGIRIEPQLVSANVKPDVKGLIEVRLDPQRFRIPLFGLR